MKFVIAPIGLLLLISCGFTACNYFAHADNSNDAAYVPHTSIKTLPAITPAKEIKAVEEKTLTTTEESIIAAGLVDIKTVDSTIVVDLKYSTTDNFLGVDVYGDFNRCYLQPDVAEKLKLAQLFLKTKYPYYNLIVYDAARPRSVQRIMWDTVDIPCSEKTKYLSNPQGGSLHNFGAAVDISIIDEKGNTLDMGTPYDFFGEQAYPREEERMMKEGKLTHKQLFNRELLRSVMQQSGFWGIATEWWHFNSCSRDAAYIKYKIIE